MALTATDTESSAESYINWQAILEQTYSVYTTPGLINTWSNATPSSVLMPTVIGSYTIGYTNLSSTG